MAREVIADIDFDNSGEVTIRQVEGSLNRLEGGSTKAARALRTEWDRTANVFTQRMFSIRSIAATVFGGATLAGGIMALKNLYIDAAKGTDDFKRLTASITTMHDALVQIIQDAPQFQAFMAGIADLPLVFAAMAKTSEPKGVGKQILGMLPFGNLLVFKLELDKLRRERDELMRPKAGPAAAPFAMPTTFLRPFGAEGAPEDFDVLSKRLNQFSPFADKAAVSTERLHAAMLGIKTLDVGGEFAQGFLRAGATVTAFADAIPTMLDRLNEAGGAFDSLKTAAGEAFGAILAGENIDLRGFVRTVLTAIASQSAVKAIFELAEGFAASARYAASYGFDAGAGIAAKLHFTAAAQFGAIAVGAGLGARAAGSGASGGGRGYDRGAALISAQPAGGTSQTINVYVDGNATEETVDKIIDAITERLGDGVSGGDFGGRFVTRH